MTWQLIAIWIIGGTAVLAFVADELRRAAARRRTAPIRASVVPLASFLEAETPMRRPAPAARPLDPADLAFAERLRRAQLKSVGF